MRERRCRVYVVQPVLPHYRLPLFEALALQPGLDLAVHASQRFPGAPESVKEPPSWADCSHPCREMLGSRLFWQSGLRIPGGFGAGDVLVVNGNPRFLSNFPLLAMAKSRGVGTVWWGHGWSPTSKPWRAWIRRRMMRLADVVLLYTDQEVREATLLGVAGVELRALNNTIDSAPIRRATAAWTARGLDEFRELHGLSGKKVLLFCGRLRADPPTELDVALRAMPILISSDPDYLLCIVGNGPDEGRLRDLSRRLGVENNIRWVGPVYDEEALAPWFLTASCFVYPGPIGLSLIHAFCYGLPVVTHGDRRLHNPEFSALRDGVNGRTFAKNSAEELCARIREICSDEVRRREMCEAARTTVEYEFSFPGMVERFADAIRTAARTRSPQLRDGE